MWLTGLSVASEVKKGTIKIDPFNEAQLNPNSYNYRLAPKLKVLKTNSEFNGIPCIDPRKPMVTTEVEIPETGYLLLTEHAYLGSTVEKFGSDYYASLVTGRSSVGRLFIKNHACAGLIDQGFYNHITLEITAKIPTLVFPNMEFGQAFWFESKGDCKLYQGKYNNSSNAAEPSHIYEDFSHQHDSVEFEDVAVEVLSREAAFHRGVKDAERGAAPERCDGAYTRGYLKGLSK